MQVPDQRIASSKLQVLLSVACSDHHSNLNAFTDVISHETYGKGSQHKVLSLLYLLPLICSQPTVEIMPFNLHWN